MAKITNPSGPVATGAANIITIGTLLWVAGGSAVIALALSLLKTTRDALFSPAGAVFAVAWLLLFMSSVAVLVARALSKPREVVTVWDCAHCITIENMAAVFDKNSDEAALQIAINFRNLGNGPIKATTEEFRVVIRDRTVPELPQKELVIPRLSMKGLISGVFRREALEGDGKENVADVQLKMIYGRHDGEYSRRYKLHLKVMVRLQNDGTIGIANGIESEVDEPI